MSSEQATKTIDILLVEDNMGDVYIVAQCLSQSSIVHRLHRVENGEEATAFLSQCDSQYADAPRPDLILLDLNLPRKDGRELLAEIKTDPQLKMIPVIVLTGSSAPTDILNSYQLHANSYVVKPSKLDDFKATIRSIESFWFKQVQFPNHLANAID